VLNLRRQPLALLNNTQMALGLFGGQSPYATPEQAIGLIMPFIQCSFRLSALISKW
jgi:hypothetical protein